MNKNQERITNAARLRWRIAYLKITQGMLSLKQVAAKLEVPYHRAEYHWRTAQLQIHESCNNPRGKVLR